MMTTTSSLFSGTSQYPIYADRIAPVRDGGAGRLVMIHGACNTGACFRVTPDGRPGWADEFARDGFDTYVVDWPGHGRSPMRANFVDMSTRDVRDSIAVLLGEIGPSTLLAHSAGGPIAWSLAEQFPDLVEAIVGVSPGPPANLVEELPKNADHVESAGAGADSGLPILAAEGRPFWVDEAFVREHWFAGVQAPPHAARDFFRSVVPESPRIVNERFNISGSGLAINAPETIAGRPILIVTGDSDPRHPRAIDQRTAELFGAEFVWLADVGVHGNGHMPMADRNSSEIAGLISRWLHRSKTAATALQPKIPA